MIIRTGKRTDAPAIAFVQVETWRSTYQGMLPDDVLARLDPYTNSIRIEKRLRCLERNECFYVSLDEKERVVGFAAGGPIREPCQGYQGELYAIYILQAYQRQGIGRLLVRAVAKNLLDHDIPSMIVWMLQQNPAGRFYQAMGGLPLESKQKLVGNVPVWESSFGWRDLRPLVASA